LTFLIFHIISIIFQIHCKVILTLQLLSTNILFKFQPQYPHFMKQLSLMTSYIQLFSFDTVQSPINSVILHFQFITPIYPFLHFIFMCFIFRFGGIQFQFILFILFNQFICLRFVIIVLCLKAVLVINLIFELQWSVG